MNDDGGISNIFIFVTINQCFSIRLYGSEELFGICKRKDSDESKRFACLLVEPIKIQKFIKTLKRVDKA